jgi:hypothetical protein
MALALLVVPGTQARALGQPEFLKNLPDTFSQVKGPEMLIATLGNLFQISCEESETVGEIKTATKGEITFTFKKCKGNSLGDPAGTIVLRKVPFETCFTKETAPLEGALYLSPIAVHLENVPLIGLISISVSLIGSLTEKAATTYSLGFSQVAGDPTDKTCTANGVIKSAVMHAGINEGTETDGGLLMSAVLTTAKAHQLDL